MIYPACNDGHTKQFHMETECLVFHNNRELHSCNSSDVLNTIFGEWNDICVNRSKTESTCVQWKADSMQEE